MGEQYIFTMHKLNKFYDNKQILKDINLCFFPGAKIGIVGDNGSGKSTLLKIMAGIDTNFDGYAEPAKNIKVGYVPQEPQLNENKTVRENIAEAFSDTINLLSEYEKISEKMAYELTEEEMDKCMNKMTELQEKIDMCDGWEIETLLNKISTALLLPDDNADVSKLSGGEKRRVALCKVLLEKPDILLLDEPTNHLDAETVKWLEEHLKNYSGTVIIVTHDRYFLDNITQWILELEHCKGIPFEGNYSSWIDQKLKIFKDSAKQNSQKQLFLEHELNWIKNSKKESNNKNNLRLNNYDSLISRENNLDENALEIQICPGPRLGNKVIVCENISKTFNEKKIIDNLSFNVPPGAIIGLIGPNGIGKTTLFNLITKNDTPDCGKVEIGDTVKIAYVNQHRSDLNGENTVFEEISSNEDFINFGNKKIPARNYIGRFNFKGSDQQKLIKNLSGGERNRVHLAKIVKSSNNVILLDEPTNDLDITTLRNLEEAILNFSGCIMVISHDRFFLDRICTHILAFEGNGKVRWFQGNFADYEEFIKKELGENNLLTRHKRYRKLNL